MTHIYKCISALSFCFLLIFSCAKEDIPKDKQVSFDLIAAHTSGLKSRECVIKVRFTNDIVDSSKIDKVLKTSPFKFKPNIAGVALWTDSKTLEFRPDKKLPAGKDFVATVLVSKFMEVTGTADRFTFKFSTMKQTFELNIDGLQSIDAKNLKFQQLRGRIITADVEDGINVEKMLKANQEGRELLFTWTHFDDRRTHMFVVDSIIRGEDASMIVLTYDGKPVGVDKKGKREVVVPSINTFAASGARVSTGMEQHIEVRFTDPLKKKQNLRGLIRIDKKTNLKFTIEDNIIKVYSTKRWSGSVDVTVEPGIKNSMGMKLKKSATFQVTFEEVKPQVRFVGKGVILPTTTGLTVPIEAVNLRAVIVEALQVFEKNIPQFLQVNTLEGSDEMKRVGRVVWKKTIPLNLTPEKINRWVRYGLDVAPLIEKNKIGIYHIRLSFKRRHIEFSCGDTEESSNEEDEDPALDNLDDEVESSYWDSWEEYDGSNWYEYYQNRENPCHPAYYMNIGSHNIVATRNVLISNIGLIAKKGNNNKVHVAVTDIQTTEPLANAEIILLDYQQMEVSRGRSNSEGIAELQIDRTPFLVIAKNNEQRGYLRLHDGSALSVSHFDISGESVRKGLKGFIYGERGVWRPGDSLFLTFVLKDSDKRLPKKHPVILELRNPRGQLVTTRKKFKSVNGFYVFKLTTSPDAPTGNWNAKIKVGGVIFEKVLKIETVMPNRLKIKLDFGKEIDHLTSGSSVNVDLSSTWLHGAIAKGLRADMKVSLSTGKTAFLKYGSYCFDDPVRVYEPEEFEVYDGRLDQKGKADVQFGLEAENVSPGMLRAQFTTRVFEPSGAFSADRYAIPFHPYDQYVGIRLPKGDKARGMLLTDTTHTARIVLLDTKGKPVPSGKVEVKMYKIKWRWWWEKGPESFADFTSSSSYTPIKTDEVTVVNGKAEWKFKIKYPSWGRYLIRAEDLSGNHCTGKIVYIDWPGWAGRAQKDSPGGANVLNFSSDRKKYTVGEDIVLTVPTGKSGRGLVSVESGSKVIQTGWITPVGEQTRYTIKATEAMTPNVYVHITYLQPHLQVKNDLPIRMYGVIPVKVVNPKTHLKPVIKAADVFKPEQKAKITISEEKGKPMTYTLAIVDEGLLDLTRFKTPDPWRSFYKREALGVKTWDIFDLIAGAYGGKLEELLAIGGGEDITDKGKKKADRFPPMVRFIGPFALKRNKQKTHTIDIPQYVGSVRVMVVAGKDDAYGSSEKIVFVKKPLMILGTLPRVLGIDEKVELPVSVFALEKKVKNVTLSVEANNLFTIEGEKKKKITFTDIGDQIVSFKLKTGSEQGIGKVSLHASGGGEKAGQNIEIDVRIPAWPVVDVYDEQVKANSTWTKEMVFAGVIGTNKAILEVSRIPPLNLGKRLGFLIRYPHGCVEQTTSSVFPQVYLNKLLDLPPEKQMEIQKNVKAGINRLKTFQLSDGGFGYWPSANEANEWSSNYAGHFLIEAQRAGYVLPPGLITQWKKYQRRRARSWVSGSQRSELIQAYRLYTLALADDPALGAMNRMKEQRNLPDVAKWRLAAAYQLAGQKETALKLTKGGKTSVDKYRELGNTYGSDSRDKAMILETLCLLNKMKKAMPLLKELSKELCSDKWMSTQTTAYILIAMARHVGISTDAGEMKISYSWNDGKEIDAASKSPIMQQDLPVGNTTKGKIVFNNKGKTVVYPRIIIEGIPAPGKEKGSQNGMRIAIYYKTTDDEDINPGNLEQGTDFVAEVKVTHEGVSGNYEEVALTHIVPSGWEIHNERMGNGGDTEQHAFEYQDIRDDRVYTYFDLKKGESKVFRILLNASYLGTYYMPMIGVEAMYDATINARVPGRWISVVVPGEGG